MLVLHLHSKQILLKQLLLWAQQLKITVQLKLALVLLSLLAHSLLRVHLIPLLPSSRLSKENLVFNLLGALSGSLFYAFYHLLPLTFLLIYFWANPFLVSAD